VASNYLGEFFGCDIKELFSNSILLKHVLGLGTVYFFMQLVDSESKSSPLIKALLSVAVYLIFVLSTKMSTVTWMIFMGLLSSIYALQIIRDSIDSDNEEGHTIIVWTQFVLTIICMVAVVVGVISYMNEKKEQYGKSFTYTNFFFGVPKCRPDNKTLVGGATNNRLRINTNSQIDRDKMALSATSASVMY
jgi:hypothetical protein